ncbi:hypothetical protein [Saccharibacillus endophyticus]|uniref:Uncharacterized protein n=1 Tax=Saccharibacillus endophyticus TaxID=2060666 RepID=A0ABQ1ZT21_9BACL|nr:hypothetical protein [Saccharibacillus endophyticus]GGH77652.1 hypothetical protein GCM10007362_21730 [Saccharibacillus endophyticus]
MSGLWKRSDDPRGDFQVSPEERWLRYLYERHSPEELVEWGKKLRYLRYRRASGGHAGDGDRLAAAIRFEGREQLESVCEALGIVLRPLAPGEEDPVWRPCVKDYPDLGQPGHTEIGGVPAFVWIYRDRLAISVSDPDNPYEVSAPTVDAAAGGLEERLHPLRELLIQPPDPSRNCVCPEHYPELFEP